MHNVSLSTKRGEESVKMAANKGTKKVDFKTRCQTTWRDLFFAIFKYVPMFGLRIAFMEYNQYNPSASQWVGFEQFVKLFSKASFCRFCATRWLSAC